MTPVYLLLGILGCVAQVYCARIFYLHAVSAKGDHVIKSRSNATKGKTVLLMTGKTISLTFCLRQERTAVSLEGVLFSNDGQKDSATVHLDKTTVGRFESVTESDWGRLWNSFRDSGSLGKIMILAKGVHTIKIVVDTDDGIEVDSIKLKIQDDKLTKDTFHCKLQCQTSLSALKKTPPPTAFSRNGTAAQFSYPTLCAEEDNVNVPLYMDNIVSYTLSATLPTYPAFNNRREPDESHCKYLPPIHWMFKDFHLPSESRTYVDENATMTFLNDGGNVAYPHKLKVTFRLEGPNRGHIDSEIGSFLLLKLQPLKSAVLVSAQYIGRQKFLTDLKKKVLLPGERKVVWDFKDFTWSERTDNVVYLTFLSIFPIDINIEELRMERRYMKPERVFPIFRSDELIIEGVDVDFWWREPEKMRARRMDTGQVWKDVDYFRISRPVPWAEGYAEVFVLYQDGNARLLQLPPPGLDWIPFGSSVIIGQTNPRSFRPASPIARVDFVPGDMVMSLHYRDGGFSKLSLQVDIAQTTLTVSDIRFRRDSSYYPFATFRSMYVADGNSDCDRVMVDDRDVFNIMDRWNYATGKTFTFFRECESKHLTLSPDIRLEITGVRD